MQCRLEHVQEAAGIVSSEPKPQRCEMRLTGKRDSDSSAPRRFHPQPVDSTPGVSPVAFAWWRLKLRSLIPACLARAGSDISSARCSLILITAPREAPAQRAAARLGITMPATSGE